MSIDRVVGFIGGGNMARAIAEGMLKQGLIRNCDLIVSSPSEETLEYWRGLGVYATQCNAEVIRKADIVIFAFKPYQLNTVVQDVKCQLTEPLPEKLYISVLAGVSNSVIYKLIQEFDAPNSFQGKLIRVMPNVLALIGEGCSGISPHYSATPSDVADVKKIFSALGKCEVVSENLLSAITGVSGSGPAYIFMIIEALSDGAVKQGLPRDIATTFAAQTVLGAGKMVLETGKHPSQLKDEVCSAGGTTIHAVSALEEGGLRSTLIKAVEAATKRSDEISKEYTTYTEEVRRNSEN